MALGINGEIEEIKDADGRIAHPASDERLEAVLGSHGGIETLVVAGSGSFSDVQPAPGAEIVVQADPANDGTAYVGPTDVGATFPLEPGAGISLKVSSAAEIVVEQGSTDETHAIMEVTA